MRAAADVFKLVCLFFLTTLLSMSFAQEVSLSGATSFGDVEIGQSIEQTFTVKNNKRVDVRLDSFWFNETDSFSHVGGTCRFNNFILRKGKSCQMKIRFTPTWNGVHSDRLTVGYFLGKGWTWQEANLSVIGQSSVTVVTPPPPPALSGQIEFQGETQFGELMLGEFVQHTFIIDNQTYETIRFDGQWFNQTDSYKVVGGSCQFAQGILASEQSCSVTVEFRPLWDGNHQDEFSFGYYEGSGWEWKEMKFSLSATAIKAPAPTDPTDPVEPPPAPADPWLRVSGNKILNSKGERVILKGVNIADPQHLDTKPWERPGVNARGIASMATDEFHAQVIRLPILPGDPNYPNEGFFSQTNGYEVYFTNHIKPLVDELTAKKVYVIIDLHYISDYSNLFPKVQEFWNFMAPKFKDNPYVMYEVFNEPINPNNWTTWKDTIAQPAVNLIRQHAPNNIILVGGPYWSSNILGAATNPVVGNEIVYVAHIYSNQTPQMWDDRYLPVINKHPVFITEWGFEPGGTEGGDIEFGRAFEQWMATHSLSWTVWTFDNRWGPRMFMTDWTLFEESLGMGTFVQSLLSEHQTIQIPYAP